MEDETWPDPYHRRRQRLDSLDSEAASSEYGTPPASPAASSLYTADEGDRMVWLEGEGPTQTDRQVRPSTGSSKIVPELVGARISMDW